MDYFNETERAKQKAFASWRDTFLAPLSDTLIRCRIRPYHITIFAVLLLLAGSSLPVLDHWLTVSILLFSYCVLDGLDGPVARRMQIDNEGGAMLDIAADQAGVAFVAAAATWHLGSNPIGAVLFASSYLSFIPLAIYANQKKVTIWTFIRIKYFFYFIYCVSGLFQYDFVQYLMMLFAAYYSFYLLHALYRIYRHHLHGGQGAAS